MEIPHLGAHLALKIDQSLIGDRVQLPPSLLNELLNITNLSQPLTFVLSRSRRKVYASVRDFTSEEGSIVVASAIADALGAGSRDTINVKCVVLEKGEGVKLVPLSENYLAIADMRATLESNLRKNYAILTKGATITVQHTSRNSSTGQNEAQTLSFLVADLTPSVDGVLIINTDLEVDIVPLDSEQAENAVKAKHSMNGSIHSSSSSDLQWISSADTSPRAHVASTVQPNTTSYHQTAPLPNYQHYYVNIEKVVNDVDVYISFRQSRPNEIDHDYYYVDLSSGRIHITLKNVDLSQPMIYFGIRNASISEAKYQLTITPTSDTPIPKQQVDIFAVPTKALAPGSEYTQCNNCYQWIFERTLPTHGAFCIRNNSFCPRCHKVFKKSEFSNHWHCDECDYSGSGDSKEKHMNRVHTPTVCTCGKSLFLPEVAQHRAEQCRDRYIICRYCHLRQKAGLPSTSARDWMLGLQLSEHESECGARTIECVTCNKPVQLKEVQSHMSMHDMEKKNMIMNGPTVKLCSNLECSNVEANPPNVLRLCQHCYGPFWSPRVDDGNKRLAQKVLETYHTQMTKGCGRSHCMNQYCRTFLKPVEEPNPTDAATQALELVKKSALTSQSEPECYLCVADASNEKRRKIADELSVMYGIPVSKSIKALQLSHDDESKAAEWLAAATGRK